MGTWTEDMAALFEDMRSGNEWRATVEFQGVTLIGIKTALSQRFMMQTSGYDRQNATQVDLLRSECVACGLYRLASARNLSPKRPEVVVNGEKFQVMDCKDDDDTDPTVKLILAAQQ